jgi:hypothetical protein
MKTCTHHCILELGFFVLYTDTTDMHICPLNCSSYFEFLKTIYLKGGYDEKY